MITDNGIAENISWSGIKEYLINDYNTRSLSNPNIRINALISIENILQYNFIEFYNSPAKLLTIGKSSVKMNLAQFKNNKKLNGAEQSVINNIFDYLELNTTTRFSVDKISDSEENNTSTPPTRTVENNYTNGSDILSNTYSKELNLLKDIYGEEVVSKKIGRLNTIYETTENLWNDQLKWLPQNTIKFLFIAEAPPWSDNGEVTYVYNPNSKTRSLLRALKKVFFTEDFINKNSNEQILAALAEKGFLIIDSLPFSMKYTSKIRNSKSYHQLVDLSVKSYMFEKIEKANLKWSDDLKMVFGFKLNALAIMKCLNYKMILPNSKKEIVLSNDMISACGTGLPHESRINRIYGL